MAVLFHKRNHRYESIDPLDRALPWTSVTGVVGHFKKPFDPYTVSEKSVRKKDSKWYKMDPADVREIWKMETLRSTNIGSWYHDTEEFKLLQRGYYEFLGQRLPVFASTFDQQGIKYAPEQRLKQGVYPEFLTFLRSARVCGQSDLPIVCDGKLYIKDYKSNKEIKYAGYTNWEGVTEKMMGPLSHLDDCNFNHYAVQLSLYLYMMLRHNRDLEAGRLQIDHVSFEVDHLDKYGFPMLKFTDDNQPIVKAVTPIPVPYLEDEVKALIAWITRHPIPQKRHGKNF